MTSPPYWRQRSYLAVDDPLKPLELGSEDTLEEWIGNQLVRRPILATVPVGGVVLDPFAGTGTTAVVANQLLRRAVLVELDPASIEAIRVRCGRRPIVDVPA